MSGNLGKDGDELASMSYSVRMTAYDTKVKRFSDNLLRLLTDQSTTEEWQVFLSQEMYMRLQT